MPLDASRAIGAYAAVMTLGCAWMALAAVSPAPTRFDTIDVERINVREPDGTLRMTIANHHRMPGMIIGKVEYPHPNRPEAGMIFFNDQGIENGGLVFDGGMKNGKPTNGGSLTFDRYMQDQTIQMVSTEDGPDRHVGFVVNDRPDKPLDFASMDKIRAMPPGPARTAAAEKAGATSARRAWLGRTEDGKVALVLSDPHGRPRLTLGVGADGEPSIAMLDASGKVTQTVR